MATGICIRLMSKTSTKTYKQFGFIVGILFPLIIGFIIPFFTGHDFRVWTLFIGIALIIFSIFAPNKLRNIYNFWMSIGNILGFVNSRIILGSIFILVLMPIGLFMKIFGYDPLRRKKNKENTYRELRKDGKVNFEKIF